MISVRLPRELEQKIDQVAEKKQITRTELVKEALTMYLSAEEREHNPYELGAEYFGKYGSGQGDLSATYKWRVKEHIDAKMSR